MSQSLRLPRQRSLQVLQVGTPIRVVTVKPSTTGCFNCGGFASVAVRVDGELHTVDCPVCTAGVTR